MKRFLTPLIMVLVLVFTLTACNRMDEKKFLEKYETFNSDFAEENAKLLSKLDDILEEEMTQKKFVDKIEELDEDDDFTFEFKYQMALEKFRQETFNMDQTLLNIHLNSDEVHYYMEAYSYLTIAYTQDLLERFSGEEFNYEDWQDLENMYNYGKEHREELEDFDGGSEVSKELLGEFFSAFAQVFN